MQVIGFSKEITEQILDFHIEAMVKIRESVSLQQIIQNDSLALIDELIIEGSNSLRICAGKALLTKLNGKYAIARIKLNKRLHELHPDELRTTYLHELAHIVANLLKREQQGHNWFWKEIMVILGLEPEICHDMDISAFKPKVKRFKYICLICPRHYKLTVQKHNKHLKLESLGKRGYYCKCGRNIIFDTMITL